MLLLLLSLLQLPLRLMYCGRCCPCCCCRPCPCCCCPRCCPCCCPCPCFWRWDRNTSRSVHLYMDPATTSSCCCCQGLPAAASDRSTERRQRIASASIIVLPQLSGWNWHPEAAGSWAKASTLSVSAPHQLSVFFCCCCRSPEAEQKHLGVAVASWHPWQDLRSLPHVELYTCWLDFQCYNSRELDRLELKSQV